MKTKPFLLATAGTTVDGRTIDDKMLDEMASSYDPKTYGARLNIEHIRGISGDGPFRAYGDVLELSVGEIDVNFNGKTEKRKALYGVFRRQRRREETERCGAEGLSQHRNRTQFCRQRQRLSDGLRPDRQPCINRHRTPCSSTARWPGSITVNATEAAALEFSDDDGNVTEAGKGLMNSLTSMFDSITAKFSTGKTDEKPEPKPDDKPGQFSVDDLKGLFTGFGQETSKAITALAESNRADIDALAGKFTALEAKIEGTPSQKHNARPPANGGGNFAKTDC